jgi:hypothetical protein
MRTKTQQTRYRLETGVFQFDEGDWPGIFIRGDDALSHAHAIRAVLRQTEKAQTRALEQGSTSEWECLIEWAVLRRRADRSLQVEHHAPSHIEGALPGRIE